MQATDAIPHSKLRQ